MGHKHLGELLLEEGLISRTMLSKALELQKTNNILLGEALLTLDALTINELERFLMEHRDNEEVKKWAEQILNQNEIDRMIEEQNNG